MSSPTNLNNLNDEQNLLLTQLSYESDVLKDSYNGMTLKEIYEDLSQNNGDSSTINKLKSLVDADMGSLRIKDVGNDATTGFGAIAFTDDNGNTGISYRGTDGAPSAKSLNDWLDNVNALVTGTSAQSAQAEAFFDKNKDSSGNNFLYGHSKGGELSESVYVNNFDDIKGMHLLNPQPLNPYSLTPIQLAAMQANKVDIVIVEGDYVWFLGTLPSYGNIRIAKKKEGKDSHGYASVDFSNGNIQEGQQPLWEYGAYFGISLLTSGIQSAGAGVGFVYNCVVRVVDLAKEELWPKIDMFIDGVSRWATEKYRDLKNFGAKLSKFLGDVKNGAKDWFNKTFIPGYHYASENSFIKVDTGALRTYADRLARVNSRISKLDRRLDTLYGQVGLRDLWSLLQADVLTGYSWRLTRCINYLNDTASDFESVERSLTNQL